MAKFKAGDFVIRRPANCNHTFHDSHKGSGPHKVVNTEHDGLLFLRGIEGKWETEYFDLAPNSCIDRLIQRANDGSAAIQELYDRHPTEFECRCGRHNTWGEVNSLIDAEHLDYRAKPTKSWKEFLVGPGWMVKINTDDDKFVSIGCEKFKITCIISGLDNLCRRSITRHDGVADIYVTKREGVSLRGHILPWDDADKILKALEEYAAR